MSLTIGSLLKRITKSPKRPDVDRDSDRCPIYVTDPEDIFIVGYPKSGNTWMQNLAAAIAFGVDPRVTPDREVNDLVPDVHAQKFYRRSRTPTFFKSHYLPRPEYRRVVYLIRDGRDAMVSYFHYLSALNGSAPDFFEMVATGEGLFPCRWHEHVEAWTKNPYAAKMITLRYESLKTDPVSELRKFCEFAELDRNDEVLKSVTDACSFNAMREKEKMSGWNSPAWPKDKAFIRRGEIGSFRDEMPPAVTAEFMRQAQPTLIRAGYSAD
jgi:hypothetical protein